MTTPPNYRPSDADFAAMTQRLIPIVEQRKLREKRASRIKRWSLLGALLVAAPAAVAGTWVIVSQVEQDYAVTCYASDSTGSFGLRVATVADDTDRDRAERALENCAAAWSYDLVREGAPPLDNPGHPVPPLIACVTTFDEVVVFPSAVTSVCESNGSRYLDVAGGTE